MAVLCCFLENLSSFHTFWLIITTTSKQRPKTTGPKLRCEKLCTSHDVKSFAIGSVLERFVVKIANDCLF